MFKTKLLEIKNKVLAAKKSQNLQERAVTSEAEAQAIVKESLPYAIDLIKSYGINEKTLYYTYGSLEAPQIVLAASIITAEEGLIDQGVTMNIFTQPTDFITLITNSLGINQAYCQSAWYSCASDALGISVLGELLKKGLKGLGTKGAMKVISKTASKWLGPIGAAVATVAFIDCMWGGG